MAWDTEQTRSRLRDAAVVDFAAHGFAGATTDRIAKTAGVNKERLYAYFGDKERLWSTVITAELESLAAAVPLTEESLRDIGTFAGALYDYHASHPHLARLLQWEELRGQRTALDPPTTAHYRRKVEVFARAQRSGTINPDVDPGMLMFSLIALAAWWQTAPRLAEMITGATPSAREHQRRRAFVAEAARRLGEPSH
ncbi:DNA-binding transcriptional regulator, AcrR family [Nakamurella panacisegetis]|uniref:DNA-binding transcriptional regulator, AcrR family n=1 Tax=Nakamurella panacisegetis TaxID=1090615 RepID=A0A1H0KJ78_9ACTN|nr:TetR family transcriptional regulator [Nakamurella panacisegetis]SDO55856.1 DNA-binding transcriptional regulator, AcrR family [Nakamurella panacisegetis]